MNSTLIFSLNAYLPHLFLNIVAVSGFGLVVFLFLLCFLIVHIIILLKLGWESRNQDKETPASTPIPEEKKPSEPTNKEREPIYYIVERKRTRPKQNYGEPRAFRFNDKE